MKFTLRPRRRKPPKECEAIAAAARAAATASPPTPEQLLVGIEARPWSDFFVLAAGLLQRGDNEEAGFWFYVGQMRGRARMLCFHLASDGEPALLASVNSVLGEPINRYLAGSVERLVRTIDRAIEWNAAHPDPALPPKKCATALQAVVRDKQQQREWTLTHAEELRAENGLPNEAE